VTSAWDKFQEIIKAKMREVYSETFIEHNLDPKNVGSIPDADGYAKITGECGDTMEVWLKVSGDAIVKAGFSTDGCGTTVTTGSMVTEMAKGKSLDDAQKISQQDVLNALGGLPKDHEHCALLAAGTLRAAIADCRAMQREPWKKAYRKY